MSIGLANDPHKGIGMTHLTFKQWHLQPAAAATRRAYAAITQGDADRCGCPWCQNYAALRARLYPTEVEAFLTTLGIDYRREALVTPLESAGAGWYAYEWWLHAGGQLIAGPDLATATHAAPVKPVPIRPGLALGISSHARLVHPAFGQQPMIQLQITATLPWVLDDQAPDL